MAITTKKEFLGGPLLRRSTENVIAFEVDPRANLIEVKAAVENLFKVKVEDVVLLNHRPRRRSQKPYGKRRDWRKAYVRLKEGEVPPDFIEGVPQVTVQKHYTLSDFLPLAADDVSRLVAAIEEGLPIRALEYFQHQSELSMQRVAKLIRIPPRTLARRREEGQLTPEESDRLVRTARLIADAVNLFSGDVAAGVEWLSKPLAALGGAIPLDVAETEAGSHEVERVIRQLEYGVFP